MAQVHGLQFEDLHSEGSLTIANTSAWGISRVVM